MAVSMRQISSVKTVAKPSQARPAVVCRAQGKDAAFAAAVAAAVLVASPAQAGVVLEQPALKKVFQSDAPAPVVKERPLRLPGSPAPPPAEKKAEEPKVEAKKVESEPLGEGGIDPRTIALPGAVAAILGLGFAASKIDDGFSEWINGSGALVRNSGNFAGFETDIKDDNYLAPAGTRTATKKGTAKVSAKTTAKKSGTQFGTQFGSLFGKK